MSKRPDNMVRKISLGFSMPAQSVLALLCMLLSVSIVTADDWSYGRATWYDDNQQGSCHYYKDIPDYYGAWPDTMEGFGSSCG